MADIHSEISNGSINQQHSLNHEPIQKSPNAAIVMWMEQDVLRRLAGGSKSGSINNLGISCRNKDGIISVGGSSHGVALAATTRNWWSQLKTAGAAIYANRHYLSLRRQRLQQEALPSPGKCQSTMNSKVENPLRSEHSIIGHVYIHPSAKVHPTALLGPNVSIGEGACIDEGVRIKESIVLQHATIGQHSLIMHSIVGRRAKVGAWCRVEGSAACSDPNPNVEYAKMTPQLPLFNALDGRLNPSITILGCGVNVESEVVLLNSIVLPYKTLTRSYKNEIIL